MKIVGLGLWLVLSLSCKKDEEGVSNCQKLEGTWQCDSWLEDNVEFLGATEFITSSTLELGVLTEAQGTYEWNSSYQIGGSELVIGSYEVNDDCNEVTLTPKDGVPATYNFHFDGDQLILEGTINTIVTELHFLKE